MSEHWCHCDPSGDARCQRECCQPRHVNADEAAAIVARARQAKPSPEDMAEAVETLRMLASRVRGTGVAQSLTRVAAWIEGEAKHG